MEAKAAEAVNANHRPTVTAVTTELSLGLAATSLFTRTSRSQLSSAGKVRKWQNIHFLNFIFFKNESAGLQGFLLWVFV